MEDIKELINQTINRVVLERGKSMKTRYRPPLLGYASAGNPLFQQLKTAVGPEHLLPQDLLSGAATVVCFYLPFTGELVKNNREHAYVARSWAEAYIETNTLISLCCEELATTLAAYGIAAAWQKPTHNFDPAKLSAQWSHKHIAYICGMGTFGVHQMLITPYGCAGRFGSLVIDRTLTPSPQPAEQFCFYHRNGSCLNCVKKCPSGALTREGLDKQKCYSYLLEVDAFFADLGLCDACGKCACCGPCAVID